MKKASEAGLDQTSASTSKTGTSNQTDELSSPLNQNPNTQQPNTQASEHMDEPMEMGFRGPSLPPRFRQSVHSKHGSDPNRLDHHSEQSEQSELVCSVRAKKHADKRKHKVWGKIHVTVIFFRGRTVLCLN